MAAQDMKEDEVTLTLPKVDIYESEGIYAVLDEGANSCICGGRWMQNAERCACIAGRIFNGATFAQPICPKHSGIGEGHGAISGYLDEEGCYLETPIVQGARFQLLCFNISEGLALNPDLPKCIRRMRVPAENTAYAARESPERALARDPHAMEGQLYFVSCGVNWVDEAWRVMDDGKQDEASVKSLVYKVFGWEPTVRSLVILIDCRSLENPEDPRDGSRDWLRGHIGTHPENLEGVSKDEMPGQPHEASYFIAICKQGRHRSVGAIKLLGSLAGKHRKELYHQGQRGSWRAMKGTCRGFCVSTPRHLC